MQAASKNGPGSFRWSLISGAIALLLSMQILPGIAREFNNIEYLCCDWGSALTHPAGTNASVPFTAAEDEVYFLKQVTSITRRRVWSSWIFGGQRYKDIPKGVSIFLCTMKADGSEKTELRELWRNPNCSILTQVQSTWLDVHAQTRKIALSVTYGGSEVTGLWTMNLDGSELKHLITPGVIKNGFKTIDCPSWTADGQGIVFGESVFADRENGARIFKCDQQGRQLVRLATGPLDCQPHVSPDGRTIAYIHWVQSASRLSLMGIDGSNPHPLPNPDDLRWHTHVGAYPAWSPDGQRILLSGVGLVDAVDGKTIWSGMPKRDGAERPWGWAHWGRAGVIGYNMTGILFTDNDLKTSKILGCSQMVECKGDHAACRW